MYRDTGLVDRTKTQRRAGGAASKIPPLLAAALFTASLGAGGVNDGSDPSVDSAIVTARDVLSVYDAANGVYLPSSATIGNDIRPIPGHAGVYLDGVTKYGAMGGMPWAAAPGNDAGWNRNAFLAGLDLYTGTYDLSAADYSNALLSSAGVVIGRSHVARQETSGSAAYVSNGPWGKNWAGGMGEVELFNGATDDLDQDAKAQD